MNDLSTCLDLLFLNLTLILLILFIVFFLGRGSYFESYDTKKKKKGCSAETSSPLAYLMRCVFPLNKSIQKRKDRTKKKKTRPQQRERQPEGMFIWSLNRQTTLSSKWQWVTEFLAPSHRAKSQNRCEGVIFPPALLDSIQQTCLWFPVLLRHAAATLMQIKPFLSLLHI